MSEAEAACADHLPQWAVVFGTDGWVFEEFTRGVGILFLEYLCGQPIDHGGCGGCGKVGGKVEGGED
ncbi:hypothetical protein [Micromonospora sp. M71_S20]|uniref:hypothetical protein n=1 Tax=Micromonospora sp. M71_S20 TaxID=592872 RepID=UPI001315A3FF|nr:hypothetical protein [Micromonospora sp. M71_S20]